MNKKGVSELIAYSLLIVIALGLALLVYVWVKSIVPGEEKDCPSDVSLVIDSYSCDAVNNKITVKLKNQGLFNVNGFFIRFAKTYDRAAVLAYDSEISGVKIVKADDPIHGDGYGDKIIEVGNTLELTFKYDELSIKKIEVIPVVVDKETKKQLSCKKSAVTEKIENCN